MSQGKCPKCDHAVNRYIFEVVEARESIGTVGRKAVSFLCPHCKAVLGVQIDPLAVKTETVAEIVAILRQR